VLSVIAVLLLAVRVYFAREHQVLRRDGERDVLIVNCTRRSTMRPKLRTRLFSRSPRRQK
jgi:hypothetical protein